ncbi:uncharacterized protein LOC142984251 [Anticarsia gemmatalis]|uniref:uncharacterized protein LOC142984251 n=1 Tax=Anticarsia gemmatalis TaxID=129554 RepID=UPI003F7574E9
MRRHRELKAAILLLILQTISAKPGKSTAPAVFEVINEQSRIDDKKILPYANPLAGNSLQNAKIHAQHQQAMFNAERMRQQRAQFQRWNKQPTQVDSYMKAYQESQENHHLALELMQANLKEKKGKSRPERPLKDRPQLEPVKVTRADAVDKSRSHRSYGSVYNGQRKRKVNIYPGPTYDQGVTIKPNGNVGLNQYEKEHFSLYTEAIPSKTQYVYPKLYSQMHGYQSANDINALNTLLSKPPQEQLSQLNTLIHTAKETEKDSLETPIDLFFYLKDPHPANAEPLQASYAGPYAADYTNQKDHTPIKEEVDDIENDEDPRVTYVQPQPTIPTAITHDDATTTKSNYYKIEVEQTVSGNIPKNVEYPAQTIKPSYEALTYEKPLNFYGHGPSTEGVKYLQSQPTGVQHLSQDGTGVSAYGDDDIHYAANYEFGYRVRDHETGNDFGHQEEKSGDNTRGQYHVLLPDGRLQQVRYSAGPDGFHADISYDHLSHTL